MASDSLRILGGLQAWEGFPVTRLPIDSRLSVDRPDLPEYELNQACPVTGEVSGLENHHIWRRSAGFGSWWVELPTGEIVGNRINLSSDAHYRVTVNKARIAYTEPEQAFYWVENDEWTRLQWQPPILRVKTGDEFLDALDNELHPLAPETVEGLKGHGVEFSDWKPAHLEPGHDCPTCKRRVPIPKKKTSPLTSVFSTRVPIGDKETFAELVDAAAEHMGAKSKPHHVYNTLLVGLALILQSPKEDLPNG